MIGLLETALGKDYILFYLITAGSSLVALCLLLFAFNEDRFVYDKAAIKKALTRGPRMI